MIMAKYLAGNHTCTAHQHDSNSSEFDSYMDVDIVVAFQSEQVLPLYRVTFKLSPQHWAL